MAQEAPDFYPPTLARSRSISLLTLFFLCFVLALARPCLPLTKAYRGQYFFRYYHYVLRSRLFCSIPFCVAFLLSYVLSFFHFFVSLRIRYRMSRAESCFHIVITIVYYLSFKIISIYTMLYIYIFLR